MKQKFRSSSFWVAVSGAIVLVINNIGKMFGFSVSSELVTNIVDSICGVLVMFGILTMPKKEQSQQSDDTTLTKQDNSSVANRQNQNDEQNSKWQKTKQNWFFSILCKLTCDISKPRKTRQGSGSGSFLTALIFFVAKIATFQFKNKKSAGQLQHQFFWITHSKVCKLNGWQS